MSDFIPYSFSTPNMRVFLENDSSVTQEFIAFLWVDRFIVRIKTYRTHRGIAYRKYVDPITNEVIGPLFDPLDGNRELYWPRFIKSREAMVGFLFKCDHIVHELLFNEFIFIDECPELGEGHLCLRVRPGKVVRLNNLKSIQARQEHFNNEDFIKLIMMGTSLAYQSNTIDELKGEGSLIFGLLSYANFEVIKKMLEYTDHKIQPETKYNKSLKKKLTSYFPIRFDKDYLECGSLTVPYQDWVSSKTVRSEPPFQAVSVKGMGTHSKSYIWKEGEEIKMYHPNFDCSLSIGERAEILVDQVLSMMKQQEDVEEKEMNSAVQETSYSFIDDTMDNNNDYSSIDIAQQKEYDTILNQLQESKEKKSKLKKQRKQSVPNSPASIKPRNTSKQNTNTDIAAWNDMNSNNNELIDLTLDSSPDEKNNYEDESQSHHKTISKPQFQHNHQQSSSSQQSQQDHSQSISQSQFQQDHSHLITPQFQQDNNQSSSSQQLQQDNSQSICEPQFHHHSYSAPQVRQDNHQFSSSKQLQQDRSQSISQQDNQLSFPLQQLLHVHHLPFSEPPRKRGLYTREFQQDNKQSSSSQLKRVHHQSISEPQFQQDDNQQFSSSQQLQQDHTQSICESQIQQDNHQSSSSQQLQRIHHQSISEPKSR